MIRQEWLDEAIQKLNEMPIDEFMSKFDSSVENKTRIIVDSTIEYTLTKPISSPCGAKYLSLSEIYAEAA